MNLIENVIKSLNAQDEVLKNWYNRDRSVTVHGEQLQVFDLS